MSAPTVVERMAALERFTAATADRLPAPGLAPAQALVARAGERLSLSQLHTVVALAGATGAGKSSIFNALAGVPLSQTGVRRPTTGQAHACVWGPDSADPLLDWLGVQRRYTRDGGTVPDLSGLVLLDLPDYDSVQAEHRAEADRLLSVVDLIVWVLHPQKYADKIVHSGYLAQFHRHRDITVVALNAADLLSDTDLADCTTDLRRLLAADGLDGLPVLATSTVGPPGLDPLAEAIGQAVVARQAALRRLSADLDGVTAALAPAVAAEPPKAALDGAASRTLTTALAQAAGVPTVAHAVEGAYVHRARKMTGWPLLRWIRRTRPDPLERLHLGDHRAAVTAATSLGPASPAATAAVTKALREAADQASAPLPAPWQDAMLAAVRSHRDELPDALDRAVAQTDLGVARKRWWWRAVGLLQWLVTAVALVGLLWLGVRLGMQALALPPLRTPMVDGWLPVPTALLAGGLLAGFLIAVLVRPVVRLAARARRRRATRRLRDAVQGVVKQLVEDPASAVLTDYSTARAALREAAGSPARR
ncbi:GTPase family protein [Catellatospora methionotrophica]|uniref:GTPase family protein n=1 Tax=Catellatospora methionotrophica TaxID=121620 RepID=UPI0033DE6817